MKNLFKTNLAITRRDGVVRKLYGRLVLLAAMIMTAGSATATIEYKKYEYDFGNANSSNWSLTMSGTGYANPTPYTGDEWNSLSVGSTFWNGTYDADMSKLAFRSSGNHHWWLRDNNGTKGLFNNSIPASLTILGLRAGDIVTINMTNQNLEYVKFDDNVHAVLQNQHDDLHEANGNTTLPTNAVIHITSDGDLVLRNTGSNYITYLKIEAIKNATYSITKNGNSTTFAFTGDGLMDYNDVAVPYMHVSFGESRNYVSVLDNKSRIYDWTEKEDLTLDDNNNPYSGNFYTFKPTGDGYVQLTGDISGTVHLFKYNPNDAQNPYEWQNGNPYIDTFTSGNISFNVKSGYYYILCEDSRHGYPFYAPYGSFHLQSFTFVNTFYLDDLGVLLDSSNPNGNLTNIHGSNVSIDYNKSFVKRYSDNIDISNLQMSLSGGQLSVSGISFADDSQNKGGTIVYHLETNEGVADLVITIPYDAGWGKWEDGYGTRTWGHVWNFSNPGRGDSNITKCYIRQSGGTYALGTTSNSDRLSIGRAGESSQLQEEIDKREWNYAQRVTGETGGFHDPMYTNVFDMEGDNADMIWETEGLWFDTETNLSCLYNQAASNNYKSSVDPDRYVGLLPDANGLSSFTIPGLKDGDRVEIFLGSGEGSGTDVAFFEITGAKDALGTPITQEYGFGGSMWDLSGGVYDYRSCYQFIKDGNTVPMKFTMTRGSMAKLYSIHIYRGEKSYQNNVTRYRDGVDGYQILNTYKNGAVGSNGNESWYQLHYRGKGESLYGQPEVLAQSGVMDFSQLWYESDGHLVKYRTKIGDYGTFRMRLKCADFNGRYVADYADQTISVGYLEKKQYPYTWDFTDLKSWIDSYAQNDGLLKEWWHASQTDDNKWVYIWRRFDAGTANEAYGLNANHNNDRNVTRDQIRTSGGQLYAGNIMLNETRGLGVETVNYDKNYNDRLRIMKDGLNISGMTQNTWAFRIPEVNNNAAVYVRGVKLGSPDDSHKEVLKCQIGSGEQQNFAKVIEVANDETGETVFVIKNTTGSAQDMRLIFNQIKVKRIAVAIDEKKVNEKGYTSESRDHAIDASLLPYFTGEDMRTYLVSSPDYDNLTVELTDFGNPNGVDNNGKYVIPANTGCVIRRVADGDDKKFDVLSEGDGFHLFVPDMHDDEASEGKFADVSVNNQFMVPAVAGMESGVPYTSNVTYNYVTLKHDGANLNNDGAVFFAYTWDNNGAQWIPEVDGKIYGLQQGANVIFVRMNPDYKNNPSWDGKWNQTANLTVQLGAVCELSLSDNLVANWQSDATAQNVDMTNYVLTYKYYRYNGGTLTGPFSGDEKFYRVYSGKTIKLHPNSAYMQLPTASVKPESAPAASRAPKFSFKFNDKILGDVNDDRSVDVADFTTLANYILGRTPETFIEKAADVNKDNDIDVADFTGVANIILGFKADGTRRAPVMTGADAIYTEPFTAIPGTQQVISVKMDNSVAATGFEFTLSLPEGITLATDADGIMASLSNDRTTARYTNFFGTATQADGTLKVLCGTSAADDEGLYTFSGNSGEVARITVNIPENYTQGMCQATIVSAKYTDQEGNAYILAGTATTGISTVEAAVETENDVYYTLSGQKLNGRPAQRGFYILNGKKVMVK